MSRYEFTDGNGYLLCQVEARTAAEAREKASGQPSYVPGAVCSHLSDDHGPSGVDAAFSYGPDYAA